MTLTDAACAAWRCERHSAGYQLLTCAVGDVQVQEKAAKAEEKRKKQLAAQEAKALKEKERLARQQQERERAMQADKS
jgi:hypothetical protein